MHHRFLSVDNSLSDDYGYHWDTHTELYLYELLFDVELFFVFDVELFFIKKFNLLDT